MKRASRGLVPWVPVTQADLPLRDVSNHLDVGLVGDVLLTDRRFDEVAAAGPRGLRDALWGPLAGCSLIVANLEGPITTQDVPAVDKPYNLKNSRRALDLFDGRFVLTLANNHVMDYGPGGLRDTIEALESAGVAFTGAGANLEEACAPRFVTIDGVTAAVIGAADPRFQAATATSPGTCPATHERLVELVTETRRRATLVVVTIHMGLEYAHLPSAAQVRLAEACLGAGARVVQFHHSHCVSGCASDGRGVVLLGTGNYAFPKVTRSSVAKFLRTAAWRVRYSKQEDAVVALAANPATIDSAGLPRPDAMPAMAREMQRIEQYSRRMSAPIGRHLWRVQELLSPSFVLPTARNYGAILKQNGASAVWRSLVGGIRVHLPR